MENTSNKIFRIKPRDFKSTIGAGVVFKEKRFITHTLLDESKSAVITFARWQKVIILLFLLSLITGLILFPLKTLGLFVGFLSVVYFIDVLFNLYVIFKSLYFPPEIIVKDEDIKNINDLELPTYSILCPLYKESEVIKQFLTNINNIDWPKNKLDVLLLLEEDDLITQEAAKNIDLPKYVRVIIVPNSLPKTKPKACNYGLQLAKGKYLVVYDAEDLPDPLQLKKAYLTFQKVPKNVYCLQAKLNYYNSSQNLLTRLFTAEYSLWFDVVLPGLQSINTSIPLGGTSNHFRTNDLIKLQGWDPFNVTEDCDLGIRLFKEGYKTAIFDSTTLEEANSNVGNWIRQRSRWIKGYLQTYFVHTRNPISFIKDFKFHALIFQLIIGLRISFILINPILWLTTIAYFVFYKYVGSTIELLYPPFIFYIAAFSLLIGNFIYLYNYMIGCAKKEQWSILKFVYLVPFYWVLMTSSAVMAIHQLIFKPYFWEKTNHGLNVQKEKRPIFGPVFANLGLFFKDIREADLVLVLAAIGVNFLNFLYNAFLSRNVNIEGFGLISLISNFFLLVSIPIYSLSATVANKTAFFLGKYKISIKDFWSITRKRTISVGFVVAIIWLTLIPFLMLFFQANSPIPFILFTPILIIGLVGAVDSGFLSGNLRFKDIALLIMIEAFLKLVLSIYIVELGFPNLVYAAIPVSMIVSFVMAWMFARNIVPESKVTSENTISFPVGFFSTSFLIKFSLIAFLSFDVLLAKHFLSPIESGKYALIALAGKMIFFISTLFSQFLIPLISKSEGANNNSNKIFGKIFLISIFSSLVLYIGIGLFGNITAPILFGSNIKSVTQLLPVYGLAILCFTISNNIETFQLIKNDKIFPTLSFLIAILQIIGISIFHNSIQDIVLIMTVVSILSILFVTIISLNYQYINSSLIKLSEIFIGNKYNVNENNKYRILIFNWYDIKNKWSGGAEIYIHKIANYLAKNNCELTFFCAGDGSSLSEETVDGIKIIRKGNMYTVPIWAFINYIFRFRGKYDLIIDVAKGIPFFTPLYSSIPVIGVIHHIHQKMFLSGLPFPLNRIAMTIEANFLPAIYKNTDMITVSKSSKSAMSDIGFDIKRIRIANPGVKIKINKKINKSTKPTLIYLGRLKQYKHIDNIIIALAKIKKYHPETKLIIAGTGDNEEYLRELTRDLKLEKSVDFMGKVSEEDKPSLLGKAWIAIQPSEVEGWGITNIEANMCGTPVIASDVDGLKDSVIDGKTGILVPVNNINSLAKAVIDLIEDDVYRTYLTNNAIKWSKRFKWHKSGKIFIDLINQKLKKQSEEYGVVENENLEGVYE